MRTPPPASNASATGATGAANGVVVTWAITSPAQSASLADALAKHHRQRQPRFAGLLVLAVHFLGRLRQRQDAFIERDAVVVLHLVAGDRVGGPRLHRAEGATLDARNLHVTGDRVAGHSKVVFQRRFSCALDDV